MTTSLVSGVHHVSLNVRDAARSREFYVDVLGLTPLPRPDFAFGGAWLGLPDGRQIHLIEAVVPSDHGQHLAFAVADLDRTVSTLRDAGVEVHGPRPVADTGARQAFASDPDGNRLEFHAPAGGGHSSVA